MSRGRTEGEVGTGGDTFGKKDGSPVGKGRTENRAGGIGGEATRWMRGWMRSMEVRRDPPSIRMTGREGSSMVEVFVVSVNKFFP